MFDQSQFRTWAELPKVYLIHEGSDQKDAAAGSTQDILRQQRVRNRLRIEPRTFIRDPHHQRIRRRLKQHRHALAWIVPIPMQNRVDRRLAHGHPDMRHRVLVKACLRGKLLRRRLHLVHALKRRLERVARTACRGVGQSCLAVPFRPAPASERSRSVLRLPANVKTSRPAGDRPSQTTLSLCSITRPCKVRSAPYTPIC